VPCAAGSLIRLPLGLAAGNVRRSFRSITQPAGIGEDRTPRELRRSFVWILSDNGVSIEEITDLVGHRTTIVTQKVYRHQLKPVITTGPDHDELIWTHVGSGKSILPVL
jgi:integrase